MQLYMLLQGAGNDQTGSFADHVNENSVPKGLSLGHVLLGYVEYIREGDVRFAT